MRSFRAAVGLCLFGCLIATMTAAYAQHRNRMMAKPIHPVAVSGCVVTDNNPCSAPWGPFGFTSEFRAKERLDKPKPVVATIKAYVAHIRATVSTACLPPSIKTALAKAQAQCGGITIISAFRPGARIAGTGRVSMHASCRAADIKAKNPSCVYKALAGWRGKLSNDYWSAPNTPHFHIDTGSYARFAHGGGRRYYAKRHKAKTHYASRKSRSARVAYAQVVTP